MTQPWIRRVGNAQEDVHTEVVNCFSQSGRAQPAHDGIVFIPADPHLLEVQRMPVAQRGAIMIDDPHAPRFAALVQGR